MQLQTKQASLVREELVEWVALDYTVFVYKHMHDLFLTL